MNEKSTACYCYNWFHHAEIINLFYQNLTFPLGKIFLIVFYSYLDSKVIGKRYLKFPFDIRELPYKLRIGKETNRQSSIYASLSGRLTGSF